MQSKRVLVTAGNTVVPIDQVRAITNIFRGKTGLAIANHLAELGHEVTLLTSATDVVQGKLARLVSYRTFDDLLQRMQELIVWGNLDVVIHSAAVSDYKVTGTFGLVGKTTLEEGRSQLELQELNNSGKVGSDHSELYLRLEPTLKIVDLIREPWGFKGKLVKFKLQVGLNDEDLLSIARHSRVASGADIIVANCLEWMNSKAYIVSEQKEDQVSRADLPAMLAGRLEL